MVVLLKNFFLINLLVKFKSLIWRENIYAGLHFYYSKGEITAQKMKFSIKDFFSKCDQIRRKLRIWSHLLKKSLMENFIFFAVNHLKPQHESLHRLFSLITFSQCIIFPYRWEQFNYLFSQRGRFNFLNILTNNYIFPKTLFQNFLC